MLPRSSPAATRPLARALSAQRATPASYYRGGTSRGVLFREADLPAAAEARVRVFLQVMGSPDAHGRQLDGLGAGIMSLSKICVVGPRAGDPRADVDYSFASIGIDSPVVDTTSNCGNMSAAVGPFAFNARLLGDEFDYERPRDVTVRIFNTNTRKYIHSTFPVADGEALATGDLAIDGVSGTGAPIKLEFIDPAGAKTGKLLPTGNVIDHVDGIPVSCVDATNPNVFVFAEDVGLPGHILPDAVNAQPDKLKLLDDIRRKAAVKMGMADTEELVPRSIPKIAIVSRPSTHTLLSGKTQDASAADVVVRFISDGQPHRAIPLTGALCTAAAARLSGSIVHSRLAEKPVNEGMVTIAHPSGRIQVDADMDPEAKTLASAAVFRTARRIMDGAVYWNE